MILLQRLAAAAILVSGWIHLRLYFDGYRDVADPNLGRSMLANAAASLVVAIALVLSTHVAVRLAGIALAVGTTIAFVVSRTAGLFGFTESGLQPSPEAAIALVAQAATVVLLGLTFRTRAPAARAAGPAWLPALVVVAVAAAGTVAVLATADDAGTGAAGTDAVTIAGFAYDPATIEVDTGETVTWTNDDDVPHTVDARGGEFSSGNLDPGDDFTFTFDTAGTYDYFCAIHDFMAGTVTVDG